jgi:hypothetical protein
MTVTERRFDTEIFESRNTRRTETVDGWFRVECEDCSDLKLRFHKEGFYPKKVGIDLTQEELAELALEPDKRAQGVKRTGIVVRLVRAKQPVKLDRHEGTLDFSQEGVGRVLIVDSKRRGSLPLKHLEATHDSSAGKGLPAHISVNPGESPSTLFFGDDGSFKAQPSVAGPVVLDLSAAKGGVILFEPKGANPTQIFREMKLAPEDGYQDHLTILPDFQGELYFFCIIDGTYGKGRVSAPWIQYGPRDQTSVATYVEVLLNPDGTRNLEALD